MIDGYIERARHTLDYQNKINQIDNGNRYLFGDEVKILILTDRLIGCAVGLEKCLNCYSDITVHLIFNKLELEDISIIPDFIVFVGYISNKRKYKILDYAKKLNRGTVSVLYSRIDECSIFQKVQYKIDACFDRDLPVSNFVDFLRDIYKSDKTLATQIQKEKINTIYLSLKKMPQFYLDILSLIYYHTLSMAATASVLKIPIKKLYVYRNKGTKMLEEMVGKTFLVKNKELLVLALEKCETEDLIAKNNTLEGFLQKADIEEAYTKFKEYIKKKRFSLYIHKIKYLYYKIYEKIKEFIETQDL